MNIPFLHLTIILITLFSESAICRENKYSKEANTGNKYATDLKSPFSMGKLNVLWEKAKLTFDQVKLEHLHSDLKKLDKEEIELKHWIAKGGVDRGGMKQSDMRRKMRNILVRYGLHTNNNSTTLAPTQSKNKRSVSQVVYRDAKLNKLWQEALKMKKSGTEIQFLKGKFDDLDEKLDEYNKFLKYPSISASDLTEITHGTHQVVDTSFDDPLLKEYFKIIRKMKAHYHDIEEAYNELNRIIWLNAESNLDWKSVDPNDKPLTQFKNPKANELWQLAMKYDFTMDELKDLHNDLRYYDEALNKLDILTREVERLNDPRDGQPDESGSLEVMKARAEKHHEFVNRKRSQLEKKILAKSGGN